MMGLKIAPPKESIPVRSFEGYNFEDLPTEFDARVEWGNICNFTIYNQGSCGSCWAFGAIEAFEDRMCIACQGRASPKVSVQEIVSCNWLSFGCSGGFPWAAWEYLSLLGVSRDACLPYGDIRGAKTSCPYMGLLRGSCEDRGISKRYYAKNVKVIVGEKEMMTEIYENGPVEVGFTVYEDFMSYESGIYEPTSHEAVGGHAVKVVGWGEERGVQYWIAANSWSERWGQEGYFKIKKGTSGFGDIAYAGDANTKGVC